MYGIVLIDVVVGSAIGPVLSPFVQELSQPQMWLSLDTVAVDSLTVALLGGVLNGLVAQQTSDDDRGEVLGVTQALTGVASLVTTLLYGGYRPSTCACPSIGSRCRWRHWRY